MTRQHLIFDADDTLWENNIYFEEAFDRFCEYLDHSELTPPAIRPSMRSGMPPSTGTAPSSPSTRTPSPPAASIS